MELNTLALQNISAALEECGHLPLIFHKYGAAQVMKTWCIGEQSTASFFQLDKFKRTVISSDGLPSPL